MSSLIPLIVFFPIAGLLINLAAGKFLGERWVGVVASGAAGLAFVIAVLQVIGLASNGYAPVTVRLADWLVLGDLHVPWAFQIDTLSVTMMLVVTGVGTLIHVYAIGYMHEDVRLNGDPGRFPRFFVYLNLFMTAMLILVTGSSYLMMFVGWEGVGLCSYLLIGFWYEKGANHIGNARAARKAFIANRVGDWAMLLAMFLIFWNFHSLIFNEVFGQAAAISAVNSPLIVAITLLLLIGATGKSAQIPLYVWLPDAMAGPTPVSALMHAATMVTAGIYMITRSAPLFDLAPVSQTVVALIGAATALFAATIAVAQFDIKKVLAYSTISQLGFMMAAVGLGAYTAGIFHLVTHAFFKALLFLAAGSVIHAVEAGHHATHAAHGAPEAEAHAQTGSPAAHDTAHAAAADPHGHAVAHDKATTEAPTTPEFDPQDMRNMGGLWAQLPITKWVYLIGGLALAGIVPFSGFWSKDEILLAAQNKNPLVYILLTVAAFLTAFYIGRQLLMVFFGKPRTEAASHAVENPPLMTVPLIILAALATVGGLLNFPTIAGWAAPGANALSAWLGHTVLVPAAEAGASEGALNFVVAGISTLLAVAGLALGYFLYRARPQTVDERDPLQDDLGPVFNWLRDKWYIDELYHLVIVRPYNWLAWFLADLIDWRFWHDWFHDVVVAGVFNTLAHFSADFLDLGVVDGLISGLPAAVARGVAGGFRRFQTGYVRAYALMVFLGVVVVLGYLLLAR
jgi:NADH-quinone oxidoreductase subunit L